MRPTWFNQLVRMVVVASVVAGVVWSLRAVVNSSHPTPVLAQSPTPTLETLTEEERTWLREHPVIRVVQDPGWPPIEFTKENGDLSGMSEEYLHRIEHLLGVNFERVRGLNWQDAYAKLKRWDIDMTTSVSVTPERSEFWAFTKPYMEIPIVIVTLLDVTYIADMHELDGKKVAVVDGYAVNDWIPRDYPGIQLVRVMNAQEGLESLQRGEVFAYIENMLVVSHYMANLKMTNLKIAGDTPYENVQSMAVRKDWAILAGILDKALDTISESERNDIYRNWVAIRYEYGFDYTLFWRVLAVFALILVGIAIWVRRLIQEIEARKKAEMGSRENLHRFQQLFKLAPMPLGLTSSAGEMLAVNDQWTQVFGYTQENVPSLDEWWTLAYPDPEYRAQMMTTWQAVVQRARVTNSDIEPRDYRVTCKNGEVRTMEIAGTFLGDDILATFFDVTNREQAEDEQRRLLDVAERSRQALLSILQDNNLAQRELQKKARRLQNLHDLDQSILMGSDSPEAITQTANENLRALLDCDYSSIHLFDRENKADKIFTLGGDGQQIVETRKNFEQDLHTLDNGAIEVLHVVPDEKSPAAAALLNGLKEIQSAILVPLVSSTGVVGAITIGWSKPHSITAENQEIAAEVASQITIAVEKMRLSLKTKRYAEELEEMVHQRTAQLETSNKELEAFAYSVSHDLRAPLRAIDGFSRILQQEYSEKLDSEGQRLLKVVRDNTNSMDRLITDLLALSRVSRSELNVSPIDMTRLATSIFHELVGPDNLERFEFKISDLPRVAGDPTLIRQVWINLISNAIKYSSPKDKPTIEISGQIKDGACEYSIKDNGVGFNPIHSHRLFGLFQRLHKAGEFDGTGVGLAIVQRIIHRHGGHIRAEGQINEGATFTFSIPTRMGKTE